jgi:hypothetical protein
LEHRDSKPDVPPVYSEAGPLLTITDDTIQAPVGLRSLFEEIQRTPTVLLMETQAERGRGASIDSEGNLNLPSRGRPRTRRTIDQEVASCAEDDSPEDVYSSTGFDSLHDTPIEEVLNVNLPDPSGLARINALSTSGSDCEVPPCTHPHALRTCDMGLTLFPPNMDVLDTAGANKHTVSLVTPISASEFEGIPIVGDLHANCEPAPFDMSHALDLDRGRRDIMTSIDALRDNPKASDTNISTCDQVPGTATQSNRGLRDAVRITMLIIVGAAGLWLLMTFQNLTFSEKKQPEPIPLPAYSISEGYMLEMDIYSGRDFN